MTNANFQDQRVLRAIELVWREAALLDAQYYPTWEELFTVAGVYVVPIDPGNPNYATSLNMIYDDMRMRLMRVVRMIQGYAPAAVAAARTAHTVSIFVVMVVSDTEVTLRSAHILSAYKRNEFH